MGGAAWVSMNVVLGSLKLLARARKNKGLTESLQTGDNCQSKDSKKKVSFDLENTKVIAKHESVKNSESKDQGSNTIRSYFYDQKFQQASKSF